MLTWVKTVPSTPSNPYLPAALGRKYAGRGEEKDRRAEGWPLQRHPAQSGGTGALAGGTGRLRKADPGLYGEAVGQELPRMVYYFDSFWCASAAHLAWNYMQNIVLGLPNSGVVSVVSIFKLTAGNGRSSFAYDPNFGIEGTILSVIVQILVCIGIYYWGSRNNKKPTDVWEEQIKEELSAAE